MANGGTMTDNNNLVLSSSNHSKAAFLFSCKVVCFYIRLYFDEINDRMANLAHVHHIIGDAR